MIASRSLPSEVIGFYKFYDFLWVLVQQKLQKDARTTDAAHANRSHHFKAELMSQAKFVPASALAPKKV